MSIFDATGRLINTLINENMEAGTYSIEWNGKDQKGQMVSTGIYFMQVISGEEKRIQKMAFLK